MNWTGAVIHSYFAFVLGYEFDFGFDFDFDFDFYFDYDHNIVHSAPWRRWDTQNPVLVYMYL